VVVRPITPADGPGLAAFHDALSDRSVYLRFFHPHPHLTPHEVTHFTTVDYRDRLALVAELEGAIVAVGRYDRAPGTDEAEVAFVVADGLQRRGIATALLAALARAGRRLGIGELTAEVLTENAPMLHVFRAAGFPMTTHVSFGTVHVSMDITDLPP
jgi:RimJ/RimL family protein N-acetyltransferase